MKPSSIVRVVTRCAQRKRPVFIWGPPGVGKSDTVRRVADNLRCELRDVRLNLMDPVDIKGYPVPDMTKKQMKWLPADFLPTKGKGILFLDEMNSAPQAVLAAAYQLTLDRRIGDYVLPDGWSIVAAGNRTSDRAVVSAMPSALSSRLVHVDYDTDLDDWLQWADSVDLRPEIIAFIRFRPSLLHSFQPDKNLRSFPCPRTWAFASELLNDGADDLSPGEMLDTLKGTVGEAAAGEFVAFMALMGALPSFEEIMNAPDTTPIPASIGVRYALVSNMPRRVTRANFDQLMRYMTRMPDEFQTVFVLDSLNRCDDVYRTAAFTTWSISHADLLK